MLRPRRRSEPHALAFPLFQAASCVCTIRCNSGIVLEEIWCTELAEAGAPSRIGI